MTQARQNQISLADTPYYHCINRCVRRAFLCGEDRVTGASYAHRKQWVVDRLKSLASVFAIDVCTYPPRLATGWRPRHRWQPSTAAAVF